MGRDATSAQYQQAQSDFTAASNAWSDVAAFAKGLAGLDFKWQDASGNWHSFTEQPPAPDAGDVTTIPSTIQAV